MGRLELLSGPDRRLDAEITAWALAPTGWIIDPIEDIDGFAIEGPPEWDGDADVWMCAADVPYVTRYLDAAIELISEACPDSAASICAQAFQSLGAPGLGESGEDFAARAARWLGLALLWSIPLEHGVTKRKQAA